MSQTLLSVLIPTYNVEVFVEEAIHSILNQTHKNLEVIVIDDCSTDNTYPLLCKIAAEDNRVKLFRNQSNRKIVDALNTALAKATGDFIARMDGDDVSVPERLEKQLRFLMENPDVDLVGLDYSVIDENGTVIKEERHLTDFEKIKKVTRYVSPIPHFWLAKKKVYEVVGPYRIPGAEDYDFIIRAIEKGFKVTNVPIVLYKHRIRTGNTATTIGLRQKRSIAYVKKLQKERRKHPEKGDSYSAENLQKWLQVSVLQSRLFQRAAKFNHRFISSENRKDFRSLTCLLLAVLFSPRYILTEKYNRMRYRRFLEKQ